MSTKHTASLKKAANTRFGRKGLMVFAAVWLLIAYVSVSQAFDTGSWVLYLLAIIALTQAVRFVKLSIKTHDNN